jgi:uncharacterized protein (DUF885 family)
MAHEGIPGHHLQIGLALARPRLHAVVSYAPVGAFGEAWAMYAEHLADEMGLVASDTARLLYLQSERTRAIRLVVDPAIHTLGWSRERALAFMQSHGLSANEAANEHARYLAIPGQGTTYTLGRRVVISLRERLEKQRGARFDVREFHDRLLRFAPLPLTALESSVE